MGFELWDTRSRNLVDWFTSEEEALAFVRETWERVEERQLVDDWLLDAVDSTGDTNLVAQGQDLVRRAFALKA
jgi:hypothetical protein